MTGKRDRLIDAARDLVHRQGYHRTTLAEIAEAALVPPGNVYYYFKTKDELLHALIDVYIGELTAVLARFDKHDDPRERLKAWVRFTRDTRDRAALYGCPYGGLSQELDKLDQVVDGQAGRLMRSQLDWAERQFASLSGGAPSRELAVELISRLQGATLLTNALSSPELLLTEARRLEAWIDTVP